MRTKKNNFKNLIRKFAILFPQRKREHCDDDIKEFTQQQKLKQLSEILHRDK